MTKHLSHRRGFTLIELLVVVSIIGLLSTLAAVSLNNSRKASRDAKRLADIKQLQTAMELFAEANPTVGYAPSGCAANSKVSSCSGTGSTGLGDYMGGIASLNDPSAQSATLCSTGSGSISDSSGYTAPTTTPCNYAFKTISQASYAVQFWLEGNVNTFVGPGGHVLTEKGVR